MVYFNKLPQKAITASFTRTQEVLIETNWKVITTWIHSNSKDRAMFEFLSTRINLDSDSNPVFCKNHVSLLKCIYTFYRNCYQDMPKSQGDQVVYACSAHEVLFVLPGIFIDVYI